MRTYLESDNTNMGFTDFCKYRIPFHFNEKQVVLKVTKYTTCDDVIEMLVHQEGLSVKPSQLAVHEMTPGHLRAVHGRELVVKVWRSWGCEGRNFSFLVDWKTPQPAGARGGLKLKALTAEGHIDALFMNRDRNAPRRSVIKRNNGRVSLTIDETAHLKNENEISEKGLNGKQFVLAKFFSDLKSSNKMLETKSSSSKFSRKRGDGSETPVSERHGDVSDVSRMSSGLLERCQYIWDTNTDSDSDSESEASGEFFLDDSCQWTVDSDADSHDLDHAFIKTSRDSDSDEGIDVRSVTSVDLNAAFVGSHVVENSTPVPFGSYQSDATCVASFSDLNKLELEVPIELETDTWVVIMEQLFLYLMILGRWALPRGEITRGELSQLLFVFIGIASDITELFALFEENTVRKNTGLTYAILCIWSISLLQFTFVLTSTHSPRKAVAAAAAFTRDDEDEEAEVDEGCVKHVFQTEVWSICVNFLFQDGPFLAVRLYAMIALKILTYSIIFFTAKNALLVMLLVYRLSVLCCERKRKVANGSGSENDVSREVSKQSLSKLEQEKARERVRVL
ncbi:TMM26-like protein [Mya arenaria]|uniref:TMM26-like protein n=1 Tax=Mya arenaria TaxID=6604 RepID=A0ABY7DCV0_MYAAR|nr:TMM26-like protein [Mya arenaria]